MEPDYHVPANRSPYRWRIVGRIMAGIVGGYFYFLLIQMQLRFYQQNIANGDTFRNYITHRPAEDWALIPVSLAMLCLVIGMGRDGWMLLNRRGTPTLLPWPYRLALVLAGIALSIYLANNLTIHGS